MSATVRIGREAQNTLRALAAQEGKPMQAVLEKAIEIYRRQEFLRRLNRDFARLRSDPKAWKEELAERDVWDAALADGLEKD